MSHGQSQIVKAATLLHKAMEYETTPSHGGAPGGGPQHVWGFICDVLLWNLQTLIKIVCSNVIVRILKFKSPSQLTQDAILTMIKT